LKDKTSDEDLLWVKGLPKTTINEWKEDDVRTRKPISYSSPYTKRASFKITKMTKGDTVTIFFIKISKDKDQSRTIGEIISASSGMHLYILFVSLS
jgi:hypothetical protein